MSNFNSVPSAKPTAPVDSRKISRVNMDNAFNSLVLILNSIAPAISNRTLAAMGIVFNRIQLMHMEDPATCIKQLKWIRKWYVELIRGNRIERDSSVIQSWYWNFETNCPNMVTDAIVTREDIIKSNANLLIAYDRIMLSILSMDRLIVIPSSPNFSTITATPVKRDAASPYNLNNFDVILERLGISKDAFRAEYAARCANFKYTVLNSAGPNGPSTWTAHVDSQAWLLNPASLSEFRDFCEHSNLMGIYNDMLSVVQNPNSVPKGTPILGKLVDIEEWGGKTRVVACVDYWTQMAMTPLHDTINHFLRNLPMDATFNQDGGADWVSRNLDLQPWVFNSFDLTAATDSIPISLQESILASLLGSNALASAWAGTLVKRDYYHGGTAYRYGIGQPMGARSSFPMLALTHHIIVQAASVKANVATYNAYRILGDDIVMTGAKTSEHYQAYMKYYGVPINLSKSVLNVKGAKPAAEFCKRIFIGNAEYTAFNVKTIAKMARDGRLSYAFQNDLLKRVPDFEAGALSEFFFATLDSESFREIMIANVIPQSVSGLTMTKPSPTFPLADYTKWFEGLNLTKNDIINVFTYTACVNSLKRLDNMLKDSIHISNAITDAFGVYTDSPVDLAMLWKILGIPTDLPENMTPYEKTINDVKKLAPNHPIIRASENEITRITELLAGLINHDTIMANRARAGLLDIMRNSLADTWTDVEMARGQGTRMILNQSLANLKNAVAISERSKTKGPFMPIRLEYNVNLSVINRSWNIRWTLGEDVTINMVKSRIETSSYAIKERMRERIKGITI